ncbi:hypothetical protein BU006_12920 [Mammaliicoccus sciuri]|uniref:hypothetical protein n=1 Tax=Mammaliicoccus sciuri TaxID=1296 RepID=UPI000D1DD6D4|nr:hypothetical protein [Mammaliicoccus sciuri]PTJ55972.1 hypothetical protein BU006_12920 [Mammaliicoccus sciuri]
MERYKDNFPRQINDQFRGNVVENARMSQRDREVLYNMVKEYRQSNQSRDIKHGKSTVETEIKKLNNRVKNQIIGSNDNATAEVKDMRVDTQGQLHELAQDRLNEDFGRIDDIASTAKQTADTNKRKWLGTIGQEGNTYSDVLKLPGGKYECTIPSDAFSVNAPQDPNDGSYIAEIDVTESENGRKQLKLIANYRNNEYRATIHINNVFSGWKRVQNAEEFEALNNDTGWVDWEIKNDATKRQTDDPNALQCQYRIRMVNGIKIAHLRVNVNNLVTQTAFGSIPSHMVPRIERFYARIPVTMNPAVVLVDVTGDLMFYVNETDKAKWLLGHYIVGEFSWIIDEVGGN